MGVCFPRKVVSSGMPGWLCSLLPFQGPALCLVHLTLSFNCALDECKEVIRERVGPPRGTEMKATWEEVA